MSSSTIVESCTNNSATIISYNSFENDIKNFDDNSYFKNKNMNNDPIFDDKIDNFCNFLSLYKNIEEEDLKKNQLLLNKNRKGSSNNYAFHTFQKQKPSKVWNSYVPKSNDEKINTLIESYLNKICDESYKKISSDFINELLKIEDLFYFDIISKKIVDKCVMDNKYQHLYIQICNKIWTNRQIHYNLGIINEKDGKFYYKSKYEDQNKTYGPFNNESEAKNDMYYVFNFKKYFMNYIQDLFINKNVNFSHIDNDEEFFLHKRQFMVIIEILGIMYNEQYIEIDILHLVIIKLFHINEINTNISSIEIDGILNIFKLMDSYKEKNKITNYFELPIFKEYYDYITSIENNKSFDIRTKYFLDDCKNILKGIKHNVVIEEEKKELSNFDKFMNEKKKNNINNMINIYNKSNDENKNNILYEVIYRYCESNLNDDVYENFLRSIFNDENKNRKKEIKYLENNINKVIMNIPDIYIDRPNIVSILKNFVDLIENFEIFDLTTQNQFIELINNQSLLIDEDEDDDDNFF